MSFTSFVRLETLSCNSEFCKSILSSFLSIPARFTSAVGLFEAVGFHMFVCYRFRCRRSKAQTRPTSTDTCPQIQHAVAQFASFLAPFLLMLTILYFQDTNHLLVFPYKKTYGEIWKRKMKTFLEVFAQRYRLCMA